jgi:hypothetical protein
MKDKIELAAWAFSVIREHVDKGSYGVLHIPMANGVIGDIKEEFNRKPVVDAPKKQ